MDRVNDSVTRFIPPDTEVTPISDILKSTSTFHLVSLILTSKFFKFMYNEIYNYKKNCNQKLTNLFIKQLIKDYLGANLLCRFFSQKQLRFEIGYSYWAGSGISYLNALKDAHVIERSYIRSHRSDLYEDQSQFGYVPYMRSYIDSVDKIFPISEDGLNYLITRFNITPGKLCVSKLGVELSDLRSGHNKDNKLTILSVSHVIGVKRLDKIVNVIAELSCLLRETKITWLHIGDGRDIIKIKSYANERLFGLKNIHFEFLGQMHHHQVIKYYQDHPVDFLINLSDSEGVPVSIMEAMAFGVPVVATDVGGVSELVNETCGLIVSVKETPQFIAKQIYGKIALFKRNTFRENVSQSVRKEHDAETCFVNFYRNLGFKE